MAGMTVCLRGWHVPLAQAESAALIPSVKLVPISPRLLYSEEELSVTQMNQVLACSSGIQCFLKDSISTTFSQVNMESFLEKIKPMIETFQERGSIAVRSLRIAGKISNFSTKSMAGKIGSIAKDCGFTVNLNNPDYELGLVADASEDIIACGWLIGDFDDSIGTASRRATERPFFRPISLDPRLARLAVNLACGPVDNRAILDPMTGTGGFAMEAITMGRNCIALDLDEGMVKGAKENIKWSLSGQNTDSNYIVQVGDAGELKSHVQAKWHGNISGLVLDPPYGRNSHGSHSHFELIKRTINSAKQIMSKSGKMVLILPVVPGENDKQALSNTQLLHGEWDEFLEILDQCQVDLKGKWIEHVHSSLSRLILLASISPQD